MRLWLLAGIALCAGASFRVTPSQRLFGHSIKNGHLVANSETTMIEHNCTTAPCTITQIHCPTAGATGWEAAVVKIYVDGEAAPGIEITLLELANVGRFNVGGDEQGKVPWGIALFGHTASKGGVYSTMRVPFGKNVRVTLTSAMSGTFWFIVRGIESYPVLLGDLELPTHARLRVHRVTQLLQPKDFISLVDLPSGTAGAVLSLKLDSSSADYNYLEACVRAYIDGSSEPIFLSSGAEDYFLSAFYFDEGIFKTPNSGLTYFDGKGTLSAYKTHDRDPIIFNSGFKLVWRNCEDTVGCGNTSFCPNQWCAPGAGPVAVEPVDQAPRIAPANYSTSVFVYEWPTAATETARCPGGSMEQCMDMCPSDSMAYRACVSTCSRRCHK